MAVLQSVNLPDNVGLAALVGGLVAFVVRISGTPNQPVWKLTSGLGSLLDFMEGYLQLVVSPAGAFPWTSSSKDISGE